MRQQVTGQVIHGEAQLVTVRAHFACLRAVAIRGADARVVDQQVQAFMISRDRGREPADFGERGEVGAIERRLCSRLLLDRLDQRAAAFFVTPVNEHVRTHMSELQRDDPAQSVRRSGDERRFALERFGRGALAARRACRRITWRSGEQRVSRARREGCEHGRTAEKEGSSLHLPSLHSCFLLLLSTMGSPFSRAGGSIFIAIDCRPDPARARVRRAAADLGRSSCAGTPWRRRPPRRRRRCLRSCCSRYARSHRR